MFRRSAQSTLRLSQSSLAPVRTIAATGRRHITTQPPHATSRSWKNSALRWGIAAAGLYYYNTSPVFAEYPQNNLLNPNLDALDDGRPHETIDQITASSRNKAKKDASILQSAIERTSEDDAAHRKENELSVESTMIDVKPQEPATDGAAELEQEAEGEGAFNPVTGEINWDCPCLGGMAHGPCGPEFREAFSCFVYSKEEPKGMECIDKFQNMQTCFREHPEHYKGELEDDETIDAELAQEKEQLQKEIGERRAQVEAHQRDQNQARAADQDKQETKNKALQAQTSRSISPQPEAKTTSHTPSEYSSQKESQHGAPSQTLRQPQPKETAAEAQPESESLVPKASHDATDVTSGDSHSRAT